MAAAISSRSRGKKVGINKDIKIAPFLSTMIRKFILNTIIFVVSILAIMNKKLRKKSNCKVLNIFGYQI